MTPRYTSGTCKGDCFQKYSFEGHFLNYSGCNCKIVHRFGTFGKIIIHSDIIFSLHLTEFIVDRGDLLIPSAESTSCELSGAFFNYFWGIPSRREVIRQNVLTAASAAA